MKFLPYLVGIATALAVPVVPVSAEAGDSATNINESGSANVYFMREYAEPTAWAVTVKVDGVKVAALGNRSYASAQLVPGDYNLSIAWPIFSAQSGAKGSLKVEGGKIYIVSIGGVSQVVPINGRLGFQMGSGIQVDALDEGTPVDLSCCKEKQGKYRPNTSQIPDSE